jgi:type IV pilus assembly protein PilC
MDASTRDELVEKLRKMGYMITRVSEVPSGVKAKSMFEKFKKPGTEDMVMFYVQFSNMLTAGIPILTVLDTLSKQVENRTLRDAVGGVSRNVEGGDSFSQALQKYPGIFPRLFVHMAKAGEASGKLDVLTGRYAEYFEKQADLHQKIQGALFYPAILLVAGVAVTLFIVTCVIPQFVQIYVKTGVRLPAPTVILFMIGTGIRQFWYLAVAAAVIVWLGLKHYIGTEMGRVIFDRFKLKIPVIGPLLSKAALSRFAGTLGTLVASGVPILEALDITKEVIGNEVLSRVIGNAYESVKRGERISEPLKVSKEFPPDIVHMIAVGEESGDLDGMLHKIADFYDISIGYSIKKLTTILEPLFLVIMGGLVGFIMASMLLPMFDMVKVLH